MKPLSVVAVLILTASFLVAQDSPKRIIALTFDDLPMASNLQPTTAEVTTLTKAILGSLEKHHAPAIGFVNEMKVHVGDDPERGAALELWLKNGQTLGNHTYSHPSFNKLTLAEFTADADRGQTLLKQLLPKYNQQLRFFRYPFNNAGDTKEKKLGFENWLAANHYEIATCTVENSDWVFAAAYDKALENGDKMSAEQIRAAYLDLTDAKLAFFEKASRDVFGHEFPQVFLLHANRLNAAALDELLTRVEKRGYRFVTLAEAQSDPVYKTPDNYVGPYGAVWIYRWASTLGKKVDGRGEPEMPHWVEDYAK
jgi:peptidoglycan/xylan/chitin deacetylase (PgdA/CDA1 family)